MMILGKPYVTKLSYACCIDFSFCLHSMFKSAVSAAFAAHSISAVFVALVIPRVRISAAFTAFAANANKGLRLRARLERRSLVTLLVTIG